MDDTAQMIRLQFVKTLVNDKFEVEATLIQTSIPPRVFYYKNGGTELGPFQGVVDVDQLTRIPEWTGGPMATFGVPFVRHHTGFRILDSEEEVDQWISVIKIDVENLYNEIQNTEPEVTTFDIT